MFLYQFQSDTLPCQAIGKAPDSPCASVTQMLLLRDSRCSAPEQSFPGIGICTVGQQLYQVQGS